MVKKCTKNRRRMSQRGICKEKNKEKKYYRREGKTTRICNEKRVKERVSVRKWRSRSGIYGNTRGLHQGEKVKRDVNAGSTRFQTCQPALIYGLWDARATDSS